LATASAPKAAYQCRTTSATESQMQMLERLELDEAAHRKLMMRCAEAGIQFISSPFDLCSVDLLTELGVAQFKVPSGEITNHPLLRRVAATARSVILSTGMSTLGEVEEAVQVLQTSGAAQISVLHCVTEYPAPFEQINLRAMQTLKIAFQLPVGYSDHTPGTEIAVAAVALGAEIIEKHLTLDRKLPGPDHSSSLEPLEFAEMVNAIRRVESALGDGIKRPALCELPNMVVARKSVVANRNLAAGHRLSSDDLDIRRPGNGLAPKLLPSLLGRTVRVAVDAGTSIHWDHLA
ncbi:MAG TPA: N-acetylneuraminate synthase family protein, partial [Acidobacteriaceae bacterium]|nr:N-acetylneuraminate synthase family protein [Acidobacteriaceae bacterium]